MMPGPLELFIILGIVLVLFGAKKLRNIGGDLGGAIKNFKGAMKEEENSSSDNDSDAATQANSKQTQSKINETAGTTIEGTVEKNKEQV